MGIPGFYSWMMKKYPKVVATAIQEPTTDARSPNPNGIEFDNLYLDMNGIIHPCFHPDDLDVTRLDLQPTSFEEVFNSLFEYIDRLFNIVRPRKLLYLAIDGVAPRSKMSNIKGWRNQIAINNEISEELEGKLRRKYMREGKKLLPKTKTQVDDQNIITPGTKFMYELSKALQGYIQTRLHQNPAWKNLKVILSDANVPGEGEHKIVCFMRSQRSLSGYDANTRHCIHGLDTDLIILALATHELHISILIEGKDVDSSKPSESCKPFPIRKSVSYEFLQIWILREYLELELQASDAPKGFKFDVERAVDDFIFICFFVGNDILPRLPSLDVKEGALDLLMTVYRREFNSLGGYLVDTKKVHEPNGAYLNLERLEKFVLSLACHEDQILQKRTKLKESKIRRDVNQLFASRNDNAGDMEIPIDINYNTENDDILQNTRQMKEELRKRLLADAETYMAIPVDEIKYGTSSGWKDRYYDAKFEADDQLELRKAVVKEYIEGLCWVLLYYFSGVPSWTWFYPHHYGPIASDFKGIVQIQVEFEEGLPREPFDMLMSVLPSASVQALPRAYRKLFLLSRFKKNYIKLIEDESFDLIPIYTRDMAKEELTEHEAKWNSLNTDVLFVRAFSDFGFQLVRKKDEDEPSAVNGVVDGFENLILHSLDSSNEDDRILCVPFELPKPSIHAPHILQNIHYPPKTVYESDVMETILWHEHTGPSQIYRVCNQRRYPGPRVSQEDVTSSSSREGLYNHPNFRAGSDTTNPGDEFRGLFRPQRTMPALPRSSNFENNASWPSPNFVSRELSTPEAQVRGIGGSGQNRPSKDSGSSKRW